MLKANDVSKKFIDNQSGCIHALGNISISVNKGEFVGIAGESGAGKSTLLNLLSGLDTPSTGDVSFDNNNYSQLDFSQMAKFRNQNFGFIFQTPHMIFHKTVIENVLLPWQYSVGFDKNEIKKRALALLEYVGMTEFHNRKPIVLSGGELQRVVFARALLLEPKVIFADEPTGSLDSHNTKMILDMLKQQSENGISVIMVSHDSSALAYTDRTIKLKRHAATESS